MYKIFSRKKLLAISGKNFRLGVLLFFVIGSYIFNPLTASAIFFLLLLPATIGAVIATIIIEAVFWCIVVFCRSGDSGAVRIDVCDPMHPDYATIVPDVDFSAAFINPGTAWGTRPDVPGPSDEVELSWDVTSATACFLSSPDTPSSEVAVGINDSHRYIPGQIAQPGVVERLRLRCINDYNDGATSCRTEDTATYSFTIPRPNLDNPDAFQAVPNLVRYDTSTQLRWGIRAAGRAPYRLDCRITGGLMTPYLFNARTNSDGFINSIPLTNQSTFILGCVEPVSNTPFTTEEKVEVIPRTYEI